MTRKHSIRLQLADVFKNEFVVLAFFLSYSLPQCAGGPTELKSEETKWETGQRKGKEEYYLTLDGQRIRHGASIQWYDTGQTNRMAVYHDGELDGLEISWYPSGVRASEGHWKSGKKIGAWVEWWADGGKKSECEYDDGTMAQAREFYLRDDRISVERVFNNKGRISRVTRWYESGQRMMTGTFKGGSKHGQWTYWEADGKVKAQGEWRDGKPWQGLCGLPGLGDAGSWGVDEEFIQYTKGIGKRTYQERGKIRRAETFSADGKLAEVKSWYENGALAMHGFFKSGQKHGNWTYWAPDRNVRARGEWRDGQPWDGVCAVLSGSEVGGVVGSEKYVRYRRGRPVEGQ